ncbi:MAG: CpXC domain-containing protein [Deltaproteobacteria bacterium]|nr:CpXC domain-containing protein [Deltaproteobacteria bacterium]
MSSFEVSSLRCPRCETTFECGTASTINVTRMPWAKEQILSGIFHRFDCPSCAEVIRLDRPFAYIDLEDLRFVQVLPLAVIDGWPEHEEITEQALHMAADPDPLARDLPGRFHIRTCFGTHQLADKIRIWDAGLDDALVELLKMELLLAQPELRARPLVELTVEQITLSQDRLVIEAWNRDGDPDVRAYAAALARYRELSADAPRLAELFPGLFHRPFRSFRRLVREPATPPPVP